MLSRILLLSEIFFISFLSQFFFILKMFSSFVVINKKESALCSGICAKESKTLERVVLVLRVCASTTLSTFTSRSNLAVDTWSRSNEYLPPRIRRRARLMFLPSAWRTLLTFFIRYPTRGVITKTLRASRRLCHL